MPIKSIIQDMKGEFGSISRKGFGGLRSRSHRVVQDSAVVVDALRQSCWANMPPELLRDVLMRIEASEDTWPPRKHVVASSVVLADHEGNSLEPGPRDSLIQCFIRRNRSNQTYHLYLSLNAASNDDGKFLLAARKCRHTTCTDYMISLNAEDVSKGSNTYIGKLRSNFLGTKFTIYDAQPPNGGTKVMRCSSTKSVGVKQVSPTIPTGNYPVAHISYELNVLGSRGPRRMQCIMDAIPSSSVEPGGVAPTQTQLFPGNTDSFPSFPFFRSISTRMDNIQSGSSPTPKEEMLVLKNKAPRWHEQLQCWCLNFNGRVTVASVKNFQLVASAENGTGGQEHENVILQHLLFVSVALTQRLHVNDAQVWLKPWRNQ
ncbi:hypothetical protein Leryth_000152 [Lithospermum erythrorhizon]|nr:hypothetical protein Leryth_000152 [Lithospermum erythrorhizon]